MIDKIETAVPDSSAATDEVQPYVNNTHEIITNGQPEINPKATENPMDLLRRKLDQMATETPIVKKVVKHGELETVSMTELYDKAYPPRTPIIDDLLYVGTYLFAGAPKIGKSFFMAQLAYHVARGIPLWDYPVHKGTVLYLALEDDYSRLQQRLYQMFGVESADNLFFATKAKTLDEGLDKQLDAFVKEHEDASLIIIDTLQKIREIGGASYSYASDYDILTKLKAFSDKYGVCLLIVHHTRKMESDDSFDMISGTNGLLGAADGALILHKKKRTENIGIMDIVGRDQPDQELTLEFDREHCIWNFKEAETELWKAPPDPLLEAVNNFLAEERPEWHGTASELLAQLPDMGLAANVLSRKLNVANSRLLNDYGILYENIRGHERTISLRRLVPKTETATICDDCDDNLHTGPVSEISTQPTQTDAG